LFAKRYARGEIRYTWFRDTRFEQQATHRETKRRRRGGKENKRRREKEEIAAAAEREQEVEEGDVEMNRLRNQKREKINRVPPSLTVL